MKKHYIINPMCQWFTDEPVSL